MTNEEIKKKIIGEDKTILHSEADEMMTAAREEGRREGAAITEELKAKIAGDAFDAGYNRCNHCYMVGQIGIEMNNESFPDKQQYLQSLKKDKP